MKAKLVNLISATRTLMRREFSLRTFSDHNEAARRLSPILVVIAARLPAEISL